MPAVARAYKFDDLEADVGSIEEVAKECFDCDIDNRRAVGAMLKKLGLAKAPKNISTMMKAACKTCEGSGKQKLAAAEIAKELAESKRKPVSQWGTKKVSAGDDDDSDLSLEG
jgi:hypothetical protein